MSSNIEIQKICMLCGQPFIAKTTVTKYCSNRCCKNAHKQKLREEKINKTNQETLTQLNSQITPILSKEYLSVREVAVLLGIGKSTVHRYCVDDQIKCIRINRKIFIRRKDIETMFDNAPPYEIRERSRNPITEFYSMEEIMEKYNYKKGWIYKIIKDNETPKVFYGGRALYSRKHIDKVFSIVKKKDNKIVFLKSWNEWAEGNYMEPDLKYGKGYINALKEETEKHFGK